MFKDNQYTKNGHGILYCHPVNRRLNAVCLFSERSSRDRQAISLEVRSYEIKYLVGSSENVTEILMKGEFLRERSLKRKNNRKRKEIFKEEE